MAEARSSGYLSIGEVLGLLLEEFPDVTISKIRFLESQGLISPERTSSGYRKFYDDDVDLLRVILTEQRQNYLPLRVIKDRLQTGEIDPTGEHLRPDDVDLDTSHESDESDQSEIVEDVPSGSIARHPTAHAQNPGPDELPPSGDEPVGGAQLLPGVLLDRAELCAMVGLTDNELDQLESFGIIVAREGASVPLYGDDAVEIARPAREFLRLGIDARHLRNWRTSAEREASLYEQLITPRFRQRSPEARAEALVQLRRLDELGGVLRATMTRHALRRHFES